MKTQAAVLHALGQPFQIEELDLAPPKAGEVRVYFKRPPQALFDDAQDDNEANYLRFRLSPVSEIALAARVKTPGEEFTGTQRELLIHTESVHERAPYERLLAGAMAGDRALFTASGSVEAAWRVVDNVLTDHEPAIPYERGTWGPPEADRLAADSGGWHELNPDAASSPTAILKEN